MSCNNLDVAYLKNVIYGAPFFFQKEEYPQIANLIFEIRDECARKVYMYQEKLRGLLQAFTVELLRIRNIRDEMSRKHPRNLQIVPAIEYVKAHYAQEIRIYESARILLKAHLSMEEITYRVGDENVSTFTRNFKKIMDMTPYQWKKSPDNYVGQMMNFKISALKGW